MVKVGSVTESFQKSSFARIDSLFFSKKGKVVLRDDFRGDQTKEFLF